MVRLRSLVMELFQPAAGGGTRGQRFFGDSLSLARVLSWTRRAPNREALLGFLGFSTSTPEAEARGLRLLRENLSAAQLEQQMRYGHFDVLGGDTGKRYRIKYGFQLNVELLDNKGRTKAVLCFVPEGNLVAGDVMLAQKLALELFESDTLKIANKFSVDYRRW